MQRQLEAENQSIGFIYQEQNISGIRIQNHIPKSHLPNQLKTFENTHQFSLNYLISMKMRYNSILCLINYLLPISSIPNKFIILFYFYSIFHPFLLNQTTKHIILFKLYSALFKLYLLFLPILFFSSKPNTTLK